MTTSVIVLSNLTIISSFQGNWTWSHTQVINTFRFNMFMKISAIPNYSCLFCLVSGLAKMEGEVIEYEDELDESQSTTKYQLTGIVVHSGQASGGHYFSYILHK